MLLYQITYIPLLEYKGKEMYITGYNCNLITPSPPRPPKKEKRTILFLPNSLQPKEVYESYHR